MMLFTNATIRAILLTIWHTTLQLIYTHHFPDKWAGYNGGKVITSIKATNSDTTTRR